jgi:very-short-patch-repair endonuclease
MEATHVLGLVGGVAEWHTLAHHGVSRTALNRAVASGLVTRVRRGCFALSVADPVRVAEVAWRGHATCITAARRRGLPVLFPDTAIHLRLPSNRSQSGRNATTPPHITRHPTPPERSGPPSVAEILDDAAACMSPEAQLAMIDAALHTGILTRSELCHLRRGGREHTDWLARHADGRAESVLETLARVALVSAKLRVESQVMIEGVGRVDLLVEARVIVELDGWEHHGTSSAFAADRRRDREAVARGFRVLRFTYSEVVGDPDGLVASVRAALCADSWPAEVTARGTLGRFDQVRRYRGGPWL